MRSLLTTSLLALSSLFATPAAGQVVVHAFEIRSSFDNGNDGWLYFSQPVLGGPVDVLPAPWRVRGGLSGGHASFPESGKEVVTSPFGFPPAYIRGTGARAPTEYSGDLSRFANGRLEFDLVGRHVVNPSPLFGSSVFIEPHSTPIPTTPASTAGRWDHYVVDLATAGLPPGTLSNVTGIRVVVSDISYTGFPPSTSFRLDNFRITVGDKIPLGGELASVENPGRFRVYVPTRKGGTLDLFTSDGIITRVLKPDATEITVAAPTHSIDLQKDEHGWYLFEVVGSDNYTASNSFAQHGEAQSTPWNFWYYPQNPTSPANVPRLYDPMGACYKFDQLFGLGGATLAYQVNNFSQPVAAFWGHCYGAAAASIIFQQPSAFSPLTQDEMEGLAALFCDGKKVLQGADKWLPDASFANPASREEVDAHVHDFHSFMEDHLLPPKRRAFLIDLQQRCPSGTPTGTQQWNQACYKYDAIMIEDPNALGDPDAEKIFQIEVTNTFVCNDDHEPPTSGNATNGRVQQSVYTLMYDSNGEVRPNGPIAGNRQNWKSMHLIDDVYGCVGPVQCSGSPCPRTVYTPRYMADVEAIALTFDGPFPPPPREPQKPRNPFVTRDRLKDLGIVKNPGF